MKILTIDFETFYSQEYSLTKMTTEEYVRSGEFEVIGVSVQVDDGEPQWFSGTMSDTEEWLKQFDFEGNYALAHNAAFDGAILSWVFGRKPKHWMDTLSMGRALHGTEVGGSLAVLAEHYGLGVKGTEVVNAKGLRRLDFPPDQLVRYAKYCKNDVALTCKLFHAMMQSGFPLSELKLIDLTIKMYSDPVLRLDSNVLNEHLLDVQHRKEELISSVTMVDKEQLMSNYKFAATLRLFGVEPPMKKSPTTGAETYAFAKTDEGFKALLEHEDPRIQALAAARLGVKSTLEETRTQRFIDMAGRNPLMPVPLRYYAAHTGRWGGDDKLNLQNLPRKSRLKYSIVAPEGYVIIDADSSQIEARTLVWLAEQEDMIEVFNRNNEEIAAGIDKKDFKYDPYKLMASRIYGTPTQHISDSQRFMGKTTLLGCFGPDTLVLTQRGWVPIVQIQVMDTLWDGEEWVTHQGVIPQGVKETIRSWGVDATPDHEILTEHGWREWSEVVTNHTLSQSAFAKALSSLQIGKDIAVRSVDLLDGTLSSNAIADGKGLFSDTTSWQSVLPDATYAQKPHQALLEKCIGGTKVLSQIITTGLGYSTELQASFLDAVQKLVRSISTTVEEALQCMSLGGKIAPTSYVTSYHYKIGKTQIETSIESIITKGMNRVTLDLPQKKKTRETSVRSKTSKQLLQTYDIALAGPRNRFTIATDAGPLIVHNCGYGLGPARFKVQLEASNVDITEEDAGHIVSTYREANPKVVQLWKDSHNILNAILSDNYAEFGRGGILKVEGKRGIKLPNGLYLKYPNLRKVQNDEGKVEFMYDTKRGKQSVPTRVYGGKIVENVCQALARIAIGEQMLLIAKKYRVVLTVHDAIAIIAPEEERQRAVEFVELCMRIRPKWAPDLPLNCESGYGASYGDC